MLSGLPIMLLLAAQAGAYGPAPPPKTKPAPSRPAAKPCKTPEVTDVDEETREIIVCAPRPEGYRIDPDIMEAQRAKKNRTKPKRPERLVDNSCASVGPMGCRGVAGIDIVAAAVTAATMLTKAVKGENVGEMFLTDPQPDEYQLYVQAKREREAKEAAAAAAAAAKAKAAAEAAAAAPE